MYIHTYVYDQEREPPSPPGIWTSVSGSNPTSRTFCSKAHWRRRSTYVLLKWLVHRSQINMALALVSVHPIFLLCFRSSRVICSRNRQVVAPDHMCESVPEDWITRTPACFWFNSLISFWDRYPSGTVTYPMPTSPVIHETVVVVLGLLANTEWRGEDQSREFLWEIGYIESESEQLIVICRGRCVDFSFSVFSTFKPFWGAQLGGK